MKPNIGISDKNLKESIQSLSIVLADSVVLYTKTRKFHWNVSGNSFMELHQLFENNYTQLEQIIDDTAERINELGAKTIGTMKEFLALTNLTENPNNYPNQEEMINELLKDYEKIIIAIRAFIAKTDQTNDFGTTDYLTSVLEQNEKTAWILRRYLS